MGRRRGLRNVSEARGVAVDRARRQRKRKRCKRDPGEVGIAVRDEDSRREERSGAETLLALPQEGESSVLRPKNDPKVADANDYASQDAGGSGIQSGVVLRSINKAGRILENGFTQKVIVHRQRWLRRGLPDVALHDLGIEPSSDEDTITSSCSKFVSRSLAL